jgi:hypothetical protein
MSELSEAAYCAGWMGGLEFGLWKALVGGTRTYGRLEISDEQLARLRKYSEAAEGWIAFDEVEEETLVPLDEWKHLQKTRQRANARVYGGCGFA